MFDDDEISDDESSAWSSEDEEQSEGQDDDAAAYGGDDTADSWEGDSDYGDASADAADLFAGQYDDDGGGAPDVANAMGPKDEYPWPPPKTMGWFQSGLQKAGDWLFDTVSDPFGSRRREIDDRKVEDARKKYGTSPAPAPGVTPIQPGPP